MKFKTALLMALILTGLCAYPQAKKEDTLMWFVGKWQSKTVFKADRNYITGGSVGGNVTVNSDGSITVQSQAGQQMNQEIDKGIGEVDQLESKLKQELTAEGFNEYHLYKFSQGAIDSAKAFYFGLKIPDGPPPGGTSSNPTYKQYNGMANFCINETDNYNAVVNFYEAHRHNKNEHYDYPPPPQADYFNCWGCNRAGQKEFDKQCKAYDTTFFQPERGLMAKADAILRGMTLMGRGGEDVIMDNQMQNMMNSLFKKSKLNPQNNGPCAFIDVGELMGAKVYLANRIVAKALQLVHDVGTQNNYNSFEPAVDVLDLAGKNLMMELGTDDNSNLNEDSRFAECRALIEKLLTKLTDQLQKNHDLTYLSDIPLMLSLSAQDQCLGGTGLGYPELLDQFTTYTLSLDMNVKVNMQGKITETAHLKGSAEMVVELDSVACVRLVLSKTENGVLTANLLENTASYPQCSPTYQGTNTYTMPAPVILLHLCSKGSADSLSLGGFTPKPASNGLWNQPCGHVPPQNLGINGLDSYFNDPNSIAKRAQDIKANASAYKAQMEQMLTQLQQQGAKIQADMAAGGGKNSAAGGADIKSVLDMQNNAAPMSIMNMGRLMIPVTLNNAKLIINQTLDAKKSNTNPQMNQLIEYGTLLIQLKPKAPAQ